MRLFWECLPILVNIFASHIWNVIERLFSSRPWRGWNRICKSTRKIANLAENWKTETSERHARRLCWQLRSCFSNVFYHLGKTSSFLQETQPINFLLSRWRWLFLRRAIIDVYEQKISKDAIFDFFAFLKLVKPCKSQRDSWDNPKLSLYTFLIDFSLVVEACLAPQMPLVLQIIATNKYLYFFYEKNVTFYFSDQLLSAFVIACIISQEFWSRHF